MNIRSTTVIDDAPVRVRNCNHLHFQTLFQLFDCEVSEHIVAQRDDFVLFHGCLSPPLCMEVGSNRERAANLMPRKQRLPMTDACASAHLLVKEHPADQRLTGRRSVTRHHGASLGTGSAQELVVSNCSPINGLSARGTRASFAVFAAARAFSCLPSWKKCLPRAMKLS